MKALFSFALLGTCLLFANRTPCHGQEFWKHFGRPDLGGALYLYELSDSVDKFNLVHFGILAGLNIPVVPIADNLSAGINPSIGFSLQLSGTGYSGTLSFEVPVYATLKFNTDATWKGSKAPVGLTAGIGGHYTGFFFLDAGINAGYIQPSYMLEVNFGSRKGDAGLYKLRWTSYIGGHEEIFDEFDDGTALTFNQFALHLLWVPGY